MWLVVHCETTRIRGAHSRQGSIEEDMGATRQEPPPHEDGRHVSAAQQGHTGRQRDLETRVRSDSILVGGLGICKLLPSQVLEFQAAWCHWSKQDNFAKDISDNIATDDLAASSAA